MPNNRPVHVDSRTGVEFTLPVWTKQTPNLAACAAEIPSFRRALDLAPTDKYDPGAALIRSQLRRYAARWAAKNRQDLVKGSTP